MRFSLATLLWLVTIVAAFFGGYCFRTAPKLSNYVERRENYEQAILVFETVDMTWRIHIDPTYSGGLLYIRIHDLDADNHPASAMQPRLTYIQVLEPN